jgi:hypothetical protein
VGIDDGGHGIGSVVEAVHELEAEGDEKRNAKTNEGKPTFGNDTRVAHLEIDIQPGIDDAGNENAHEKDGGCRRNRMIELPGSAGRRFGNVVGPC